MQTREPPRSPWPTIAAVAAITLVGALLRVHEFSQSLYGDELWSVAASNSPSPRSVIDFVQSDQEISPPLFAILAWLSAKLGDAANLIRLPSIVAGIALIPLVWLLGRRTVGSRAALVAAAIAALSPFLAFYSVEARAYSLMAALVTASTVAMLIASERGDRRWWFAYGALSCLAMYSHYTAAYALLAQLAWLLWRRPPARKPALLANVGAAVAFLPWVPSLIDDFNSPSQDIIGFLAPFSFRSFVDFTTSASFGSPLGGGLHDFLGTGLEVALFAGIALGSVGAATAAIRDRRAPPKARDDREQDGILLPVMLALASPVGVGLVSLLSADQFLPRNLAASWAGFSVALAAILTRGPRVVWIPATALVVGVFAVGAVRMTTPEWARPDVGAAAALIEAKTGAGVVVIDALTFGGGGSLPASLDLAMSEPFQRFTPQEVPSALTAAAGSKLVLVGPRLRVEAIAADPELTDLTPSTRATFQGLDDTEVLIYAIPSGKSG